MDLKTLPDSELERRRSNAALVLSAPASSDLDKANAQELIRLINHELDRRRSG
jgi:hypothetical protein